MIDILIRNATVITVDAARRVLLDAAIAVDAGQILAVGPDGELAGRYPARTVIDGRHKIAMPGLINCHMHLPQVLMRGVNDNVETMELLKGTIWPIQGCYDAEDALASARLGLLEMIKAGTTAFIGTGLHPRYGIDALAAALVESGLRGVLSKYVMDQGGYALDESALHPGLWEDGAGSLRQACDLIERWHGAGAGRLQIWFSPRSVGGVSPELFREVSRLAGEYDTGITTHWAEVPNNVAYTREKYGLLPAEFAAQAGMLGPNVTLAHGIYFTEGELDLLAESGTNICHCPVCNSKLAMGTAPVPAMLRRGVNVCLGNDGMVDNNTADMFREMRASLLMLRNTFADPIYPTAAEAIEMATIRGARAIRAGHLVGSLEAGKRGDIILIDARQPHLLPVHDPVSAVAWAASGRDVDTVLVDGKIIMQGRRVLTMDEDQVLDAAVARQAKILEQAGVRAEHVWPVT
jgi:cytosine/adenosine deaminase-related metal-dependent hydrolase